jgi:hypothetical protein
MMTTRPFTPAFPNSFFAMTRGTDFYATDLAGLTTVTSPFVGIKVARISETEWTLDTFRVHFGGLPDKQVRADRWTLTLTGSATFNRDADRTFPPDPPGAVRAGHYPGELPALLKALLFDVSGKQP